MPRVLLTAFEPYDRWKANASWLALVQLTQNLPDEPQITTRLYPVDFAEMKARLAADLSANFDYALHVGQAPGSSRIQLEAIGLNIGGSSSQSPDQYRPLVGRWPRGVPLRHCRWPIGPLSCGGRRAGTGLVPCRHLFVQRHALLVALFVERMALATQTAFIHVPLDVSQVVNEPHGTASLPVSISSQAVRLISGGARMTTSGDLPFQYFWIDDILRQSTIQPNGNLPSGARAKIFERFDRHERGMRGDDHPWIVVRRLRKIGRLRILHVERRAGQLPVCQCRGQRRVIDQSAARRVDQIGRGLHLARTAARRTCFWFPA